MHKIVVAITGASGSVYAKLLLDKLLVIKEQWSELSVVMTENAKLVWKTELDNDPDSYRDSKYDLKFYCPAVFFLLCSRGVGKIKFYKYVPQHGVNIKKVTFGPEPDAKGAKKPC